MKHKYYRLLPKTARAGREEFGDNTIRDRTGNRHLSMLAKASLSHPERHRNEGPGSGFNVLGDVNLVLFMYYFVS